MPELVSGARGRTDPAPPSLAAGLAAAEQDRSKGRSKAI